MARLVLATAGFAVVIGVPALLLAWPRSPLASGRGDTPEQPVEFDHRHHVRDDGIDCLYCHYDATRAPTAGVPETAVCMGCHAQIHADSPLLEPVRESWFSGRPIAWQRVNSLPDFVFFDHAIHSRSGVGCETCHGRVDTMAKVAQHAPLTMGWCLDCHREPERFVRPASQITTMGYAPPEPQLEQGRRLVRQLALAPPTHCTGCHR